MCKQPDVKQHQLLRKQVPRRPVVLWLMVPRVVSVPKGQLLVRLPQKDMRPVKLLMLLANHPICMLQLELASPVPWALAEGQLEAPPVTVAPAVVLAVVAALEAVKVVQAVRHHFRQLLDHHLLHIRVLVLT